MSLLFIALGFWALYFVIRLAVRHGTLDAWKRLPGGPGGTGESRGPAQH